MTRKEIVIDCYIFVANCILLMLQFNDSVNEQEREPADILKSCTLILVSHEPVLALFGVTSLTGVAARP